MKNFYFQKIPIKRTKNQKKTTIKNIKIKDPLIGFVIDVITWIIHSGLFVIYVIYQKVKIYFIVPQPEIVNKISNVLYLEVYLFVPLANINNNLYFSFCIYY